MVLKLIFAVALHNTDGRFFLGRLHVLLKASVMSSSCRARSGKAKPVARSSREARRTRSTLEAMRRRASLRSTRSMLSSVSYKQHNTIETLDSSFKRALTLSSPSSSMSSAVTPSSSTSFFLDPVHWRTIVARPTL